MITTMFKNRWTRIQKSICREKDLQQQNKMQKPTFLLTVVPGKDRTSF